MEKSGCGTASIKEVDDLLTNSFRVGAENSRAACLKEVKILVAVNVIEICTLCLCENKREGIVESKVMLNAAGDYLASFLNLCF